MGKLGKKILFMKKTLIIIGSLLAVGGIVVGIGWYLRSVPKISVERVDWLNKKATVNMNAGKGFVGGVYLFGQTAMGTQSAGYSFENSTKGDLMYFKILKDGIILKETILDFKNQHII